MDIPIVQNPTVPLPAKVIAKRQKEKAEEPSGNGWWSLTNLSGSLEKVKAAVDASTIPDYWKAAIKADLDARCGADFNFVYLDAHYFTEKGNASLHYTATPDKKLI